MGWLKAIIGLCAAAALSGCSSLLYYPSPNLFYDPSRLNLKPEEVHFLSKDGTKLFGWYFPSRSKKPSKATVVFFHGNAENISSHYLNAIWMIDYPYDLFVFDYRGYGRSEGSPDPEGTVNDGIAALEWATKKGKPLVVFGQSLGGAIALSSAIETKDRLPIKFVAVDSTFASYRSMGRQVMSRSFITWPFQWLGWLLLCDSYAPDGKIASLSPIPLLVIHGALDNLVEIKMGERIFAQAGEPKEFWRVRAGGHTDIFTIQDPSYKTKFIQMIEKAIP